MQEEEQKLIDMDQVTRVSRSSAWNRNGIIFLDEIDKIAGREGGHGPDVSREGVQRDILPIVEGTTVNTKPRLSSVPITYLFIRRRGRIPRFQTVRPYSRTAGPLPHSRGIEIAHRSRFHPHS